MKVKCDACKHIFDGSLHACPECGGMNFSAVTAEKKRTEPLTIAELQKWYKDRKLPPSSVTHFYIGENTKNPKAFGIYQDKKSGKFVVYKNKASGERAVRYEGDDEAFAVKELHEKLKEEISKRKRSAAAENNIPDRNIDQGEKTGIINKLVKLESRIGEKFGLLGLILYNILFYFTLLLLGAVFIFIIIAILAAIFSTEPKDGYYRYDGSIYYYISGDLCDKDLNWYTFDTDENEWSDPVSQKSMPEKLKKKKTAKKYYISSSWEENIGCTDFSKTISYRDHKASYRTERGYYSYDDVFYYHLDSIWDEGWYYYTDYAWTDIDSDSLPEDLQHPSRTPDYYFKPSWDSENRFTDFTDTEYYSEYLESQEKWDDQDDWDDDDYDWDDDYSWDYDDTDWDSDW